MLRWSGDALYRGFTRNGQGFTVLASSDLVTKCQAALAAGMDFPTLWNEVLKSHPLVIGPPMQGLRNGQACLEIRLLSGRVLVFDSAENRILAS